MLFDFRSISRPIIRGPISFIRFNWHANNRAYNFQYAVNLDNDVNNFIFVEWKSGNRREMVHENGLLATTTDVFNMTGSNEARCRGKLRSNRAVVSRISQLLFRHEANLDPFSRKCTHTGGG